LVTEELADHADFVTSATRMRRIAPSVAQAEVEGTLVLIADDHPTNRLLLTRQVKALGYAVETCENGVEAYEKWKSGRFGIVITDCNMPEMDGYELSRNIRNAESVSGARRIPIVACTANALAGEAETCFAAGMDDYLAKPIELKELLKKLDQWVPIPDVPVGAGVSFRNPAEISACSISSSAAVLDRSVLAGISGGDDAVELDILLDFRRVNDEDAAMFKQAVLDKNMPQVTRASHRIKGATRMVGAMALAGVCDTVERASRANDWDSVEGGARAFHDEWVLLNAHLDSLWANAGI
jgi:CheY-like chemotaxis protein/HPt (histidine-containing phosphotransfer) domain-containing protein